MQLRTLIAGAALAAGLVVSGAASAAIITFDSAANGQQALPDSYQPLLTGYAGDGGALGVTIDWGGAWSSQQAFNGGVRDHSASGLGYVGYDGNAGSRTITFSQAVTIPSFFFANYNGGTFDILFQGFTNIGDTQAAVSVPIHYSPTGGYQWAEITAFANTPIRAFTFSGDLYKQLDDITVLTAGVPEPTTWALMLLGFGGMGAMLRARRRPATAVA